MTDETKQSASKSNWLPFSGIKEQAEFLDILGLVEAGLLDEERAQARVMALYQIGLGAWLRATAEIRPALAASIAERIREELSSMSPRSASDTRDFAQRVSQKTPEILLREKLLLSAIARSNHPVETRAILELVKATDPKLKENSLSVHLKRLVGENLIAKAGKGLFGKSDHTISYMKAIEREFERRGLG